MRHNLLKVSYGDFETMTETQPKIRKILNEEHPKNGPVAQDQGHFGITIDADGTWWREGLPFTRQGLVKLFSTVLRRDEEGQFWLQTPVERGRIDVEDSPFTAVEMEQVDGVIRFRTNLDAWVPLDQDHPLRITEDRTTGEPRPYITVRANLEARLLRPVFYALADLAVEQDDGIYVESAGTRFKLGEMSG